jgi:acrylyl-CoA reductase (NADPH)
MIKALLVRDSDLGIKSSVEEIVASDLPQDGELLVKVHHSSINYKDALAITNNGKIIRGPLPFVPGIDLVGTVVQSTDDRFPVGIKVIGTGGGLGETTWGGLSTLQRVPSKWFVRLPPELSPHDSMVIGTAGVTAMLSVMALERAGVRPDAGDILVTGATGGVGSFAVKLLSIAGYNAIACTGKKDAAPYLSSLGATRIVDRHQFNSGPQRPLDKATWAGAIDTLGTSTLARIISQTEVIFLRPYFPSYYAASVYWVSIPIPVRSRFARPYGPVSQSPSPLNFSVAFRLKSICHKQSVSLMS